MLESQNRSEDSVDSERHILRQFFIFQLCPGPVCRLNISEDLLEHRILLIKDGGKEFLYPHEENYVIYMEADHIIEIHCPGRNNKLRDIANENLPWISAKCFQGSEFLWKRENDVSFSESNIIDLKNINCAKTVGSDERNQNKRCNHNKNDLIEIGFSTGSHRERWLTLIEVCHDQSRLETLWVRYSMSSLNDGSTARSRNFKKEKSFGDIDVNGAYSEKGSFAHRLRAMGCEALTTHNGGGEQFNCVNWNEVEMILRDMIKRISAPNALLYTELFYKMVLMPELGKGLVFIGINDLKSEPGQVAVDGKYYLCTNIIKNVLHSPAILGKLGRFDYGYIYACDVDSFIAGLSERGKNTLLEDILKNLNPITCTDEGFKQSPRIDLQR